MRSAALRSVVAVFVLGGFSGGCAASSATSPPRGPTSGTEDAQPPSLDALLADAKSARVQRDHARALRLLAAAEAQGAPRALRAELQLELGQYASLLDEVTPEESQPPGGWQGRDESSNDARAVALLAARAALALGRREEAEARLSAVRGRPDAPLNLLAAEAALLLAEQALRFEGRKRAESELSALVTRIESGASKTPADAAPFWVIAGRAAALLREAELSNAYYNRAEVHIAERSGSPLAQWMTARLHRSLLRYRAELFIDKHDQDQARQVLLELLEMDPADVEGRLLLARWLGEESFDFAAAEELAIEVLRDNALHTGAMFLLGGITLRDMDLEGARQWVTRGLKTNPRDLDLLALDAAIAFLAEQRDAFDEKLARLESLSPENARPHRVVAEFAEWEHRYPDIERLMRRASRLDRRDPHVRSVLGLTLVRAGSDAAGVVELNRAYSLDPYDVRVVNTLQLYEQIIPGQYVSERNGPFRFRYPKAEASLLARYVPDLAARAWEQMRQRYGYEPTAPIDIELYASPDHFGVRTAGVVSVGIQGVCFGRKLATVTPQGSPANLGMTLWHEIGHVFHIGLSDHRVPRYLTEGLAEWETKSQGRGWEREMDRELHQVRESGGEFRLSRLSRAFSHARHSQDMAAAYYASSLLSEFIVERFGEKSMVRLLAEMGRPRLAREVVPDVLGQSWSELDTAWDDYLDGRLAFLREQFVPLLVRQPAGEVAAEIEESRKSDGKVPPDLRVRLGLALLAEGELDSAAKVLDPLAAQSAQARFALARIALAGGKPDEAEAQLASLQEAGIEGATLALTRARLALTRNDVVAAKRALERALEFEPRSEETLATLATLLRRSARGGEGSSPTDTSREAANDPPAPSGGAGQVSPSRELLTEAPAPVDDEELAIVRRWAQVAEHDPTPHRRLVRVLTERGETSEAVRAAERLIWVDLSGMESHRLAALALAAAGDLRRADFEFESALLCPGDVLSLAQLGRSWRDELLRRGQPAAAERAFEKVESRLAQQMSRP